MSDINETGALFQLHKLASEHGDLFPNIKAAVMEKLRTIEAEHAQKPAPAETEPTVVTSVEVAPEESATNGRRI